MRPRQVLIVEDESIVQLHLARIVEELGHHVAGTAGSVAEALAAAERTPPEEASAPMTIDYSIMGNPVVGQPVGINVQVSSTCT